MNSLNFQVPERFELAYPIECHQNHPDYGISVSTSHTAPGLTISWDDKSLIFAGQGKSIKYERQSIITIRVDRDARLSRWRFCELIADLHQSSITIFSVPKVDEKDFDVLIKELSSARLPFEIKQ